MQPKLPLYPYHTEIDSSGHLTLHNHRLVDLVSQFGTPLYVYDVGTIRHQIAAYRTGLAAYTGTTRLTYASKAYLSTAMARLMTNEGVGFDVASAGELFIAQKGGAAAADMHLHGNNKTLTDLSFALDAEIGRIVVDNVTELETLEQLAIQRNQPVQVWLRVTPNVTVTTHHRYTVTGSADSKFGFPLAEAEVVAGQLVDRMDSSPLQLSGLHLHLGSHFHDIEPLVVAVEKLLDIAQLLHERCPAWQLRELCPGGGWGVRYHLDDPPMPVEPSITGLVKAVEVGCRRRGMPLPLIVLEPGRSLVAQAGIALYTVGARKVIAGVRTYVSVDGGLADNPRPALYRAGYTALLANKAAASEVETVAIAGPYCESGDVMIEQVSLPVAAPGDILAVPVAGAYQLSMSSNYNAALRPAVLFVAAATVQLVQRRETVADLIQRDP